mmetsp:Transcript_47484/g.146977  ORF Transcript_47484/g.146977 Transcript_47484/m.146977 type:complete len:486 (-) Transcript_47484:26-1483(-)
MPRLLRSARPWAPEAFGTAAARLPPLHAHAWGLHKKFAARAPAPRTLEAPSGAGRLPCRQRPPLGALPAAPGASGALGPELLGHLASDLRALDHGLELGVDDLRGHVHGAGRGGEAAVGAGHDVLGAHEAHVVHEALRHEPWVLDVAGGGVQHARHQHLALGQLGGLEDLPLVAVARVAGLDAEVLGLGRQHELHDLGQRHVVVVRARVVAPADVHPQVLRGDLGQRLVQHPHSRGGGGQEVLQRRILELRVPAHGQVRAVHLQREACGVDGLVLALHGPAEGLQVLAVVLVVVVLEEVGERSRRRRGEKDILQRYTLGLRALDDARNLLLQPRQALVGVGDLPAAGGVLHLRVLRQRQQALAARKLAGVLRHLLEVGCAHCTLRGAEAAEACPRGRDIVPAAQLAVIEHVQACLQLPRKDPGRLGRKPRSEVLGRRLLPADEGQQCRRPRQRTHMRGLDADLLGSHLHGGQWVECSAGLQEGAS